MAIISNLNQDDDENQQNPNQQGPAAPSLNSGASSVITPNAPATPQNNNSPSSSGRFNNITNYIRANQGFNQQQGGLAGKITNNIQNNAKQAKDNIKQANNNFNNEAQKNRVQYDSGLVKNALDNASTFVKDEKNVQQFANQRDASYKGPQELQNQAQLQANAQNVQNLAQNTGSESGRFNLLRQMFNRPTYSSGQQKLDNLLLQSNKDQLNQLQSTRSLGNQVNAELGNTQNAAMAQAKQFANEAATTSQLTRNALGEKTNTEYQGLDNQVRQAQKDKEALLARLSGGLSSRQLSGEDLSRLGLTENQDIYNLNLTDYFSANGPEQATRSNVADKDTYARMNALNRLAGNTTPAADFGNEEAAGSFTQNQYNFDMNRFMNDRNAREAGFNNEYQPALQNYQDINSSLQSYYNRTFGNDGQALSRAAAMASKDRSTLTAQDLMLANLYDQYVASQNSLADINNRYQAGTRITKK